MGVQGVLMTAMFGSLILLPPRLEFLQNSSMALLHNALGSLVRTLGVLQIDLFLLLAFLGPADSLHQENIAPSRIQRATFLKITTSNALKRVEMNYESELSGRSNNVRSQRMGHQGHG